jgi:Tol biopolymer transport system component
MRPANIKVAVVSCLMLCLCGCSSDLSRETIACHVIDEPLLSGGQTRFRIYVMNGDGSERREVGEGRYPEWSPDGRRLVVVGSDFESLHMLDLEDTGTISLAEIGQLVRNPVWSPDGENIAFHVPRRDIWVIDADGSNVRQLTDYGDGSCVGPPSWSPGATRIAFSMSPDCREDTQSDIYVINSDGSNVTRLTDGMGYYWKPIWSPQEDRIVYNEYRDGESSICVMNGDGSGKTRRAAGQVYGWSPDGTRIYYHQIGSNVLWSVGADGSNPRQLFKLPCEEPAWSPVIHGEEAVQ